MSQLNADSSDDERGVSTSHTCYILFRGIAEWPSIRIWSNGIFLGKGDSQQL